MVHGSNKMKKNLSCDVITTTQHQLSCDVITSLTVYYHLTFASELLAKAGMYLKDISGILVSSWRCTLSLALNPSPFQIQLKLQLQSAGGK